MSLLTSIGIEHEFQKPGEFSAKIELQSGVVDKAFDGASFASQDGVILPSTFGMTRQLAHDGETDTTGDIGMAMDFTNMVGSEIESFLAHVFTRMNTGLEEQRGRGGRAGGRGGDDQVEGQSERGEEGDEVHFG